MPQLEEALVRAGARRIVSTESHVYSGELETVTVRNQQRAIDFATPARIEVLVERARAAEISAAFEQFASGGAPWFTVDVDSVG